MKIIDITTEKQPHYRLGTNEKAVFFMLNRCGKITFELAGIGAEAHIFAFFIGKKNDKGELNITQKHTAPKTISDVLVKSVLFDKSQYSYTGLITLIKQARQGSASQENRALLLSPLAAVSAKPSLEILANDVKCRHAATSSSLNPESLFFVRSRGLSGTQATTLLVSGFFNGALEKIRALGTNTDTVEKIRVKMQTQNMCL